MPARAAAPYKSLSQQTRAVTESWAADNLYCANCDSPRLRALEANTPATDFLCPRCDLPFQLKCQSHPLGTKIVDAAFDSMIEAIEADATPNLFALHYARAAWKVENLFLIPRFALSHSAIEKRPPLRATARRAGWVGCNILLSRIPPEAHIPLVLSGVITPRPPYAKCISA